MEKLLEQFGAPFFRTIIFNVSDILPSYMKEKYSIIIQKSDEENQENPMGLGYLKIDKIQ